jgi:cobalt-zinc-cadmium efflux system membrane fusion protein
MTSIRWTTPIVGALAAALAIAGCSRTPDPASGGAAGAAGAATAGYFTVPADQLAHLAVAPVQKMTWTSTVRTTGTVDWDHDHTAQAITQVGGPITRLMVDTGDRVKAGDPLLYVSSPDVNGAIAAFRKAQNQRDLARRTLDRDRDLLDHKAISPRAFEATEAAFNDAATDLEAARQALRILGVSDADLQQAEAQNGPIRPELPMRAPIGGTVVERLVLPGQVIEAGSTVAFVITDPSTVWVQAHVYEKDLGAVQLHDRADITAASLPKPFTGTVGYIGDVIDPATRTTPVRIVTRNPGSRLKKDMFVDVTIHDPARRTVLTVPVAAVLYDDENFPFVYVQAGPGRFARRSVTLGVQQDDRVAIATGLAEGDRVVSEGSVFLQFANSHRS